MMDVPPRRSFALRAMISNSDRVGSIVCTRKDDPRITRVRRRFRKRSRDELPQPSKILKGHMNFVVLGVTLAYQGYKYKVHQGKQLMMSPGITGWTEVNGRWSW